MKRSFIVVVAVLIVALAGLMAAQSTTPTPKVDPTFQTKQDQNNTKQKPSAIKTSKVQGKKSTSSQNVAYAAAYKAGIPHSDTPSSPK
jgi:hypothetical protein